jgi:hypothetical protein
MTHARLDREGTQRSGVRPQNARQAATFVPPAYGIALVDRGVDTGAPVLRRACATCAEEEDKARVIRRSSTGATTAPSTDGLLDYLHASAGGGRPLDPDVRASFEGSLGVGLGGVRVVSDAASASAAHSLGARAFTLGSTIWFGQGEYAPSSPGGRRLLAHEVAHTVQQRSIGPAIQREVVVGDAHDPAEATADRAADAMMRGDRAPPGAGGGESVLRRACTAQSVPPRTDQRLVTCDDNRRWIVTHRRVTPPSPGPQPNTEFDITFPYNGENLGVRVHVCRGGTSFIAELGANLPGEAMRALWSAINGRIPSNITLRPYLALILTQSGSWRITAQGGPSIGVPSGTFQGAGGGISVTTPNYGPVTLDVQHVPASGRNPATTTVNVEFPFPWERSGTAIERIDCSRLPPAEPEDIFECRPIIPRDPGEPPRDPVYQDPTATVYALFRYATDEIIGWYFAGDPIANIYPAGDQRVRARVTALVQQGFQPSRIVAHTSPEGLRNLPNAAPGQFHGNDPLSRSRGAAAQTALQDLAGTQTYQGRPLVVVAAPDINPELYSPPPVRGREVEGRDLDRQAIPAYVTNDPLRPADPEAFRRMPLAQQRALAYPMLRRADIILERDRIRTPGTPGRPEVPEHPGDVTDCPTEIRNDARRWFLVDLFRQIR